MAKRSKLTFDLQELEELLKSFHLISNTRIAIFDDEFQKIIAYPKEHLQYCQILREGKNIKEECKKNDLWGCRCCKEKRDVFQYTCHAGLQEVVLPLWDGDIIIGYLMLGQIVLKKDNESAEERWQVLKTRAEQYHIDVEKLHRWYESITPVSTDLLEAYIKIMEMCASHLKQKELIKLGDVDLSKKIAEYIEENLFEEITVEEICDKFGIKKTKLYQITGHSFGKSFRAEILTLRMQKAREMLRNSDKKIYEIAETVGYPDYNYFTKVFKKETGMTPRNYRNQYYSSQGEL